jgi:hypothetical protein
MHDPRVGRFFAIDPLFRDYPWNSPYAFSENDVIRSVELEGLEKLALSGSVPKSQYHSQNTDYIGETAYTEIHVNTFAKQTTRLNKLYGFNASKVSTGNDVINKLIAETKSKGYVSFLGFFGHGSNNGFLLKCDEGFYTSKDPDMVYGAAEANLSDLKKNILKGNIKFSKDAVCFIDACNNGGLWGDKNEQKKSFAYKLAETTGMTVIAGDGHVEMDNPNNANGKFKITDGGSFYKFTATPYTKITKIDNPDKSWYQFWKPSKVEVKEKAYKVTVQNIGTEATVDDYVK